MTKSEISALENMRAASKSSTEIAAALHLSVNTVRSHIRRHPLPNQQTAQCRNCSKKMSRATGRKVKLFCSDKCRNVWWNNHQEMVKRKAFYSLKCTYCGKEFISYGNKNRKYCGRICYNNSRKINALSDDSGIDG